MFAASPCIAARKHEASSSGWAGPCQGELLQPTRWVQQWWHCCDGAGACRQMAGKSE